MIARLVDPGLGLPGPSAAPTPSLVRVDPLETAAAAEQFMAGRTRADPLVARAYACLEEQTDRMFAALTDASGPYRVTVVATGQLEPYADADEVVESVLTYRTLEVTTAAADRAHPRLGGEPGGSYYRFRAVHDLVGHAATGFAFDADGEYSAWVVQRRLYTGLARWAAATELHGEISALWATGEFAEHKAILLSRDLAFGGGRRCRPSRRVSPAG
jgi:hypothetical protein